MGGDAVFVAAPGCDKCGQISVLFIEGYAMVAIPRVENRFFRVLGDGPSLMKG